MAFAAPAVLVSSQIVSSGPGELIMNCTYRIGQTEVTVLRHGVCPQVIDL